MKSLSGVQLTADLARLSGARALLLRKWTRMSASPFTFLRGASALWAEALRREPALLRGLPGEGALVGDLHLENFGTFRTRGGVALHVNDFDECLQGPWAFDALRLLTSALLARPELGCSGVEALGLADALLEGHAAGLAGRRLVLPPSLERAVQEAGARSDDKLLAKRLEKPGRLLRDERQPAAPARLTPLVRKAVASWAGATRQEAEVLDVSRRVAGTGSLGVERLLALVRVGEASRLLELKEVRGSTFSKTPADAAALLATWRRCLPEPPGELAAASLGGTPVIVRPLFAADDKLSVEDLDRAALPEVLRALGHLAGQAHRRGATTRARWTAKHHRLLVVRASALAGLHEQAFLEFCLAVSARLG